MIKKVRIKIKESFMENLDGVIAPTEFKGVIDKETQKAIHIWYHTKWNKEKFRYSTSKKEIEITHLWVPKSCIEELEEE